MYVISFDMGICNLAYCILYVDSNKKYTVKEWKKVHLDGNKKNLEELASSLLELLDTIMYSMIDDNTSVTWLIENQPAFKAPTMKSLQMVVYTFVMMMRRTFGDNHKAKFMSASSKLKLIENKTGCKIAKQYKTHKEAAIKYTEELIRDDVTLLNILNNEKKKDDLADCFLQAVSFIDAF